MSRRRGVKFRNVWRGLRLSTRLVMGLLWVVRMVGVVWCVSGPFRVWMVVGFGLLVGCVSKVTVVELVALLAWDVCLCRMLVVV